MILKEENMHKDKLKEKICEKLSKNYKASFDNATHEEIYKATAIVLNQVLDEKRWAFNKVKLEEEKNGSHKKKVYYISMEFLLGQSLKNNLYNLGLTETLSKILAERDMIPEDLYALEPDAGLGNGGLGRLSACYMDALATLGYDVTGYCIKYEYGLFKQKIIDGWQVEMPDVWLPGGNVWLTPREDDAFVVNFGGTYEDRWTRDGGFTFAVENAESVKAVPYDVCISGADSEAVAVLRLWDAQDMGMFDMTSFASGDYTKAARENTKAEAISKVLYPADNHLEGKELRLKQQYFMVSASCQNIIRNHVRIHGTLDNLPEKIAIHINDTHPALCIPELMRIIMDQYGYQWEQAYNLVTKTVSYTNHTILEEALEKWPDEMVRRMLPRVYAIIAEFDRRFREDMDVRFPGDKAKIDYMSIIAGGYVRMANLSVAGSHKVNGVSALHSDIIKKNLFRDFYLATPEKFTNVTNGIAYRRWLCQSNPELSSLLDECIGQGYRKNAEALSDFLEFKGDESVLKELGRIKRNNKVKFSNLVHKISGITPDPDSIFIVQAKRLHEYKRQLLNALRIISRYQELLENPDKEMRPETYFFAAKTAPNYYIAKNIIQLIAKIGAEIEKSPKIAAKLRVIFLENYNVSMAEAMMPATEVSQQISLAGKEASGTGNMKMMINGAVTIGTMDGANVEIFESVGEENIFIFGQDTKTVQTTLSRGYAPESRYAEDPVLRRVVDRLEKGFDGLSFAELKKYLLIGTYGIPDPYMCLEDFADYCRAHDEMNRSYEDVLSWNRMSLVNIAKSGRFSADRSIRDYARDIWYTEPIY